MAAEYKIEAFPYYEGYQDGGIRLLLVDRTTGHKYNVSVAYLLGYIGDEEAVQQLFAEMIDHRLPVERSTVVVYEC